jgi:hypothetical protein
MIPVPLDKSSGQFLPAHSRTVGVVAYQHFAYHHSMDVEGQVDRGRRASPLPSANLRERECFVPGRQSRANQHRACRGRGRESINGERAPEPSEVGPPGSGCEAGEAPVLPSRRTRRCPGAGRTHRLGGRYSPKVCTHDAPSLASRQNLLRSHRREYRSIASRPFHNTGMARRKFVREPFVRRHTDRNPSAPQLGNGHRGDSKCAAATCIRLPGLERTALSFGWRHGRSAPQARIQPPMGDPRSRQPGARSYGPRAARNAETLRTSCLTGRSLVSGGPVFLRLRSGMIL